MEVWGGDDREHSISKEIGIGLPANEQMGHSSKYVGWILYRLQGITGII